MTTSCSPRVDLDPMQNVQVVAAWRAFAQAVWGAEQPPAWHADALCVRTEQVRPAAWFAHARTRANRTARALCADCPVFVQCRAALAQQYAVSKVGEVR